jgi:hypothetical protein
MIVKQRTMKLISHMMAVSLLILSISGCSILADLPSNPTPTTAVTLEPVPSAADTVVPTRPVSSGPSTRSPAITAIPPSGFEPQPGDENLKHDQAFLDVPSSQLVVIFATPVHAEAILIGTLPDPCHVLRVVVTPADVKNTINLAVYSVVDPEKICAAVLSPFTAMVPLIISNDGDYTVMANGELLGKFSTVFTPQRDDDMLTRGDVNIDLNLSKLITLSDLTGQEAVFLQGNLPDPCHQMRVVLNPAGPDHRIGLDVYSVYDPKAVCIMVIVPFQLIVPLGNNLIGHYSLYVNGQLLGEFDK